MRGWDRGSPTGAMGGWELLPDEVLLSIFAACSAQERQWTLHQVSKTWNKLVSNPLSFPVVHREVVIDPGAALSWSTASPKADRLCKEAVYRWMQPRAPSTRRLVVRRADLKGWEGLLHLLSFSLEELQLDAVHGLHIQSLRLLPGLRELVVRASDTVLLSADLAILPTSLETLTLEATSKDSEGPWPLSPSFLSEFPAHLLNLTGLKALSLSSRGLSSIPEAISRLSSLTSLQISNGRMRKVPSAMSTLTNLKHLGLSGNQLCREPPFTGTAAVPPEALPLSPLIPLASCLTSLDLSDNGHHDNCLPDAVYSLTGLSWLSLSHNNKLALTCHLSKLRRLRFLDIGSTGLRDYPPGLTSLTEIRTLLVGGNQLGSQLGLERSRSLAELHNMWASPQGSPPTGSLSGSPLWNSGMPLDMDPRGPSLTNIRSLDLSRTCLACLPASLNGLPHLEELLLCGIVRAPGTAFNWESLRSCSGLLSLDVSHSFMAGGRLPPALSALTRLHTLKANECALQELGVLLPTLCLLELDGNQLRYVPVAELEAMRQLAQVSLVDNASMQIPCDIHRLGALPNLARLDLRKTSRGLGPNGSWSAASMWAFAKCFAALEAAQPTKEYSSIIHL